MKNFIRQLWVWAVNIALMIIFLFYYVVIGFFFPNARTEEGFPLARRPDADAANRKPDKELVVLLHGINRNNSDMMLLQKEFVRRGYRTLNWSYPANHYDLRSLSDQLNKLLQKYPAANVDFVCHSMGGLLCRSYLKKYRPQNVRRVVMIGTPNSGASVARIFAGQKLFDMVLGPAGQDLAYLNEEDLAFPKDFTNAEFGIIIGHTGTKYGYNPLIKDDNDGFVGVNEAKLEGAKETIMLPYNHIFIHMQTPTIRKAADFIEFGTFNKEN